MSLILSRTKVLFNYILFVHDAYNSNCIKAVEDKQIWRLLLSHNGAQLITASDYNAHALNEIDSVIEV